MESMTGITTNTSSFGHENKSSCYQRDYTSRLNLQKLWPEQCHGYVKVMFGQVFPLLAVLVTVCNLTVVAVFVKPKVRSHTSFILTLIALSDILNILCPSIVYIYFYTFGNYDEPVPFHLCRLTYYLSDTFKDMFNCFSLWSTVLLAYFRCRCITSPFRTCEIHTRRNIIISISIIVGLTIAVYLPSLFIFDFIPVSVTTDTGHVTNTCSVIVSDFLGRCVLRKLHLWLETVLSSAVPCVLLIFLNSRMLWSLRTAKRNRDSLLVSEATSSNRPNNNKDIRKWFKLCSNQENGNENEYVGALTTDCYQQTNERNDNETSECPYLNITPQITTSQVGKQNCFVVNLLNVFLVKCQCKRRDRPVKSQSIHSRSSTYKRLNRESRRTSWYIVLVVTIIASHEIPMAVMACHTLLTHDGHLPAVMYGCNTLLLLLWQYIAYTLIFLVYWCMCSTFRNEWWKTVSCKRVNTQTRRKESVFMSPCLVRELVSKLQSGDSQREHFTSSNKTHSCDGHHIDEDLDTDRGINFLS